MDDQFSPFQINPQHQATIREMELRSHDRIRVFNPLDEDYTVQWDSVGFLVPNKNHDVGVGRGQAVVYRYIAVNYLDKMSERVFNARLGQAVVDENKRRINSGMAEMSHQVERLAFETRIRQELKKELPKIWAVLWLGVEEEYGAVPEAQVQTESEDARISAWLQQTLNRPASQLSDDNLPSLGDITISTGLPPTPPAPATPSVSVAPVSPPPAPVIPPPLSQPSVPAANSTAALNAQKLDILQEFSQ